MAPLKHIVDPIKVDPNMEDPRIVEPKIVDSNIADKNKVLVFPTCACAACLNDNNNSENNNNRFLPFQFRSNMEYYIYLENIMRL